MPQPRISPVLSIVVSLFLVDLHRQGHLYLDAGTGSIVLQTVVGALVGTLVAAKLFWNQIKAFLGGLFSTFKKSKEPQEQ